MTDILLVGDIHGDSHAVDRAFLAACHRGVHDVVFMGDVGVGWEGTTNDFIMHAIASSAHAYGMHAHVLLGNHENWDLIEPIRFAFRDHPSITLLDRSGVLWIDGHPIAYQAGGCSIDQYGRIPGRSWWWQELPTENDLQHLMAEAGDLIISLFLAHDSAVPPPMRLTELPPDLEAQCQQSRDIVRRGVMFTGAELLVHGHFHYAYDPLPVGEHHFGVWKQMGLANNDGHPPKGMAIINLDTLAHTWI